MATTDSLQAGLNPGFSLSSCPEQSRCYHSLHGMYVFIPEPHDALNSLLRQPSHAFQLEVGKAESSPIYFPWSKRNAICFFFLLN